MGRPAARELDHHQPPTTEALPSQPGQALPAGAPPSPAQVDKLIALVPTTWSIDYDAVSAGAGKPVTPRGPASALYLNDLKIAPEGEPGHGQPAATHFAGIDIAGNGAATLGAFDHPQGHAGRASASIRYGTRPTFAFSIKHETAAARREHAAIVRELVGSLDEFVDEAGAQAALDRLIGQHFPGADVNATVLRKDHASTAAVNTTTLHYAPIEAARDVRLRINIPTATKDKSVTYTTSANGETVTGQETAHGMSTETETSASTAHEQELKHTVEDHITKGLTHLAEQIRTSGLSGETTTVHDHGSETHNGTSSKLSGGVKGHLELPHIPGVSDVTKKLFGSPSLDVNVSPDFSSDYSVVVRDGGSGTDKDAWQLNEQQRNSAADSIEDKIGTMLTTTLKSSISAAIKTRIGATTSGKQSDAAKTATSSGTTTTVGSIVVVASSPQPTLTEE